MTTVAAPTAIGTTSRERVIPELLMAIAAGECHWPADVRFDDHINLLTLTFDTLDQFAAWANHLHARRDKPAIGQRIAHGAHTTLLGWNVTLCAYTQLTPAAYAEATERVSL